MASSVREEEELDVHIIPENFANTGRCFNGMFRTRNLIEGGIFAALPAYLIVKSSMAYNDQILALVLVCGCIIGLFVNGINGDSVLEFLYHLYMFRKKQRVAKYNPRVKFEATPGYLTKEEGELPRDKIVRVINEFRNRESKTEDSVSRDIYDPMYKEFFEDDLGFVDTPDDLKSKSELRQEAKMRKRAEKEARIQEKLMKKQQAKDDAERAKREMKLIDEKTKDTNRAIREEKKRLKKAEKQAKRGR